MRARFGGFAMLGFALGIAAGALLWTSQMLRFRRDLFSASSVKRLAALGYLGGSRRADSARLLREYVRWERNSALRKRGQRLLRRLEESIHS